MPDEPLHERNTLPEPRNLLLGERCANRKSPGPLLPAIPGHCRCRGLALLHSMMRKRKNVSPMMISSPPNRRRSVISSPLTNVPFEDLASSM